MVDCLNQGRGTGRLCRLYDCQGSHGDRGAAAEDRREEIGALGVGRFQPEPPDVEHLSLGPPALSGDAIRDCAVRPTVGVRR